METNTNSTEEFLIQTTKRFARRVVVQQGVRHGWVYRQGERHLNSLAGGESNSTLTLTYDGRMYRRFTYTTDAGETKTIAVRERKGLKARMEAMPKTEASAQTLKATSGSVFYLSYEATPIEASVTYTNQWGYVGMKKMTVCYTGVSFLGAEVQHPREGHWWQEETKMRVSVVRHYSPVKSEKTPHRMVNPGCRPRMFCGDDDANLLLPGRHASQREDVAEWLNADGSVAFRVEGFEAYPRNAANHWLISCPREWVVVKGEWTENKQGTNVSDGCLPWLGLTDVLSTKASSPLNPDTPGEDQPMWLEDFYLRRVAFKEELAAKVFHPARVERMDATYGEGWMERV